MADVHTKNSKVEILSVRLTSGEIEMILKQAAIQAVQNKDAVINKACNYTATVFKLNAYGGCEITVIREKETTR